MKSIGVLAYWFGLLPSVQLEWADWYIRDHMPSRLGATFTGARCFRAVSGEPEFMALYETWTPEALTSNDYLALLRNASEGDKRRRSWYQNTTRACCRKLADVGNGQGGIVASIRFSSVPEAMASEVATGIVTELARIERVGRVAWLEADPMIRARMDEARVTGHDDDAADQILLVECSAESDAHNAVAKLTSMPTWPRLVDPASVSIANYRLLYSIAK